MESLEAMLKEERNKAKQQENIFKLLQKGKIMSTIIVIIFILSYFFFWFFRERCRRFSLQGA
jgi:flagellar biogenesis protein FliO